MAKKTKSYDSFKLDYVKKEITLYSNVEPTDSEKLLIEIYIKQGFIPKIAEKKETLTVKKMRADLEKNLEKAKDEEKAEAQKLLNDFNKTYEKKVDEDGKKFDGFHEACKIYNKWVKAQKEEAKPAETETK